MALGSQSCFFGLGRGRVRVSLTVNELGIAEIFYVQTAKVNEAIEVLFTSGNSSEHSRYGFTGVLLRYRQANGSRTYLQYAWMDGVKSNKTGSRCRSSLRDAL